MRNVAVTHDCLSLMRPLLAGYRSTRGVDRMIKPRKQRLCNISREDLLPAEGGGSAVEPSTAATVNGEPDGTGGGDSDDGDDDADAEPERRRQSRQNTVQTASSIKSRDQIETLIDVLVTALEQLKPKKLEETLWDVEQIAQWLGLSKITVDARVVTRPGFPAAFRPVDSKQAQRRWFASDVHEWARMNTGVIPTARLGRKRRTA